MLPYPYNNVVVSVQRVMDPATHRGVAGLKGAATSLFYGKHGLDNRFFANDHLPPVHRVMFRVLHLRPRCQIADSKAFSPVPFYQHLFWIGRRHLRT